MQAKLISFLKLFIPFSILLFIAQFAVVNYLLNIDLYYTTLAVYSFHIVATFLIYLFLVFVNKSFSDKTGFAFMACSLLKMLAAVLFLLPMMLNDVPNPFEDLILFFIPYFLFLIFETIYAVKLINTK
ncbi:hypothetical protein [Christiangramia forsetii]|uniref:Membrane protein n=2 Tax=Christiangramia forsetii TaxID=411153 RepID=A0M6G9_CHRFK|nr:hypothetical protein [Christiangramia forsetii]GGG30439.1 hypothetical protein GCM10011532_12430 [Christiangramia forsetii]CAL68214.1 membrane protein [Christiangramia forsetii KT0803]